ncbi:MAG: RidA family protein [Chloroflexi bacterium]|nr:RidA family protein [Chloroflexota bacterium]
MSAEDRVKELGLDLSNPPKPAGNYVPAIRVGNIVYLSGHGPVRPDGTSVTGKVGAELSVEEGYDAARLVGIGLLSSLKAQLGSLDKVRRVVKTLGMVNAAPDFTDHPQVINGASDIFREVFGENGIGARSAVGMGSLPFQIPVEVEMIIEVEG